MPSTATSSLRLQKMATGEKLNTWGTELNDSGLELIEDAIAGWQSLTITGNTTLTSTNYVTDQARMAMLSLGGSPGAAFNLTIPAVTKWYWIRNATGQTATVTAGGVTVDVLDGEVLAVLCDGTDVYRQERTKQAQALDMSSQKITSLGAPTADTDAATKKYVDDENTSQSAAIVAAEAAAAASATAAASSATSAAASYDSFDDRYLGAKASDPSVDNDGDSLQTGALYFNTTSGVFKAWNGSSWITLYTDDGVFSNLNIDSGVLYVDATNDRVGVNTTSPQYTGDFQALTGDASLRVLAGENLASADAIVRIQTTNTSASSYLFFGDGADSDAGFVRYNHSTDALSIAANTAEALFITSAGRVGVNEADPDRTLHVTSPSHGDIAVFQGPTAGGQITLYRGTSFGWDIGVTGGSDFFIGPNAGSAALTIDALTGDVGIGNTSPAYTIDTSNSAIIRVGTSGRFQGGSASDTAMGYFEPRDLSSGHATIQSAVIGGTPYELHLNPSGGYVGIGTNAPATATGKGLDIHGAGGASVRVDDTTNFVTAELQAFSAGVYLGSVTNHSVTLLANNSAAMTVLADGTIGIGTTSPTAALHVDGPGTTATFENSTPIVLLKAKSDVSTSRLYFGDTSADLRGAIFYDHSDDGMSFWSAGSENAWLNSSGQFGIGVEPDTALHVSSGTTNLVAKFASTDATATLALLDSTTTTTGNYPLILSRTGNATGIWAGGSERISILDTGSVGVGTTSPGARFHAVSTGSLPFIAEGASSTVRFSMGNTSAPTGKRFFGFGITSGSEMTIQGLTDSSTFSRNLLGLSHDGGMTFYNASSAAAGAWDASNVRLGVGTTTPTTEVHVVNDGAQPGLVLEAYNASASGPSFDAFHTRGTVASPTATQSGDVLVAMGGGGYDGTAQTTTRGKLQCLATEAWTASAQGAYWRLQVTDTGATGRSTVAEWRHEYLDLMPGGSSKMRVLETGEVGIGTTSPSAMLDARISGAGDVLRLERTDLANMGLNINFGGADINFNSLGQARDFVFLQDNSEVARIDTTGNLGLGTTSPTAKIDAEVDGSTVAQQLTVYDNSYSTAIVARNANGTASLPAASADGKTLFSFGVRGYDGTAFAAGNKGVMTFNADGLWSGTNNGVYWTLQLTPNGSTSRSEVLRATSGGALLIGETAQTASELLRVGGEARVDSDLTVEGLYTAKKGSALSIVVGAITVTGTFHEVHAESGTTDTLDTINGGHDGAIIILMGNQSAEETITYSGAGNIKANYDANLGSGDTHMFIYDSGQSEWRQVR